MLTEFNAEGDGVCDRVDNTLVLTEFDAKVVCDGVDTTAVSLGLIDDRVGICGGVDTTAILKKLTESDFKGIDTNAVRLVLTEFDTE